MAHRHRRKRKIVIGYTAYPMDVIFRSDNTRTFLIGHCSSVMDVVYGIVDIDEEGEVTEITYFNDKKLDSDKPLEFIKDWIDKADLGVDNTKLIYMEDKEEYFLNNDVACRILSEKDGYITLECIDTITLCKFNLHWTGSKDCIGKKITKEQYMRYYFHSKEVC